MSMLEEYNLHLKLIISQKTVLQKNSVNSTLFITLKIIQSIRYYFLKDWIKEQALLLSERLDKGAREIY